MSVTTGVPNGKLYIGSVPWCSDYSKGVMLFDSRTEQQQYFYNNFKLATDKLSFINPNGELHLNSNLEGVENLNYIYYVNDSDISNTYYCCFITNWKISAKGTTILSLKLDVFQQYIFKVKFNSSIIERTHISKALDDYKKWTQNEPISINAEYENVKTIFNTFDWTPYYIVESVSFPNGDDFIYGGVSGTYGIDIDFCPLFAYTLGGGVNLNITQKYTELIEAFGGLVDHRTDVLHIRVVPKWLYDIAPKTPEQATTPPLLLGNPIATKQSSNFTIDTTTLANGYTPKNKKMLGSLCRLYSLINYNGFKAYYKPEFFNINNPRFTLEARPIGMKCCYIKCDNYSIDSEKYVKIPYDLTFNAAYNSNTGVQKSIAERNAVIGVIGASAGVVESVGGLATNIASGNVMGGISSGANAIGSANNLINSITTLQQSHIAKTGGTSSTFDELSFSNDKMKLRMIEINPSFEDCKVIDDFLSVYGYAYNEYGLVTDFYKNRSNWNYIKTSNINISLKAPHDYLTELAEIFNNGVTIWHKINEYGDYSKNNN